MTSVRKLTCPCSRVTIRPLQPWLGSFTALPNTLKSRTSSLMNWTKYSVSQTGLVLLKTSLNWSISSAASKKRYDCTPAYRPSCVLWPKKSKSVTTAFHQVYLWLSCSTECTEILIFLLSPMLSNRNVSFRNKASIAIHIHTYLSAPVPAIVSVRKTFSFQSKMRFEFNWWALMGSIGQKYAMLEIKVVLATLLRRYQFSVPDADGPLLVPTSAVVLKPKAGVSLIVTKRSKTLHAQNNST